MRLIRTATYLVAIGAQGRRMANAPTHFDGTLDELFERYIARNVLSADSVAHFHRHLVQYVGGEDPLFLIRMIRNTERRQIYVTSDGSRFKATDNAPAWWIHSALFQKAYFEAATFPTVIATIPTHLFDIARYRSTANASGWHFAHIFHVEGPEHELRVVGAPRCDRPIHPQCASVQLLSRPEDGLDALGRR